MRYKCIPCLQASHRTGSRTAHARSGGGGAEDPRRLRPRARAAGADEQTAGTRVQDARLAVGCVQGINFCTVPSHNCAALAADDEETFEDFERAAHSRRSKIDVRRRRSASPKIEIRHRRRSVSDDVTERSAFG